MSYDPYPRKIKLRKPYRFEKYDYGYWNKLNNKHLIVKRKEGVLIPKLPIDKRIKNVKILHIYIGDLNGTF